MMQAPRRLSHLDRLEAEAIHIMREVVAECERPVMLYSIGKDSAVMLHLARKAFHPARLPIPILHVDTTWKFREMIEFRDRMARQHGLDLIVHINAEGVEKGVGPFTHGSALHTHIMKTEALKQALETHRFDAAFGGARRDEEKSRAKERVVSVRSTQHRWDPKQQRPELWRLYNSRITNGETISEYTLFIPYHWGGKQSANQLTIGTLDPVSKIPEFKVCACQLTPTGKQAPPATVSEAYQSH
jgi:sulfate adenylyltransferase subunit 2